MTIQPIDIPSLLQAVTWPLIAVDKSLNELTSAVLCQRGSFIGIVEPDKRFRGLVDRTALLEKLGEAYLKQQV